MRYNRTFTEDSIKNWVEQELSPKNFLILLVLSPFFFKALSNVFHYTLHINMWNAGDWLINYQAGFIRRGAFGELLYFLGFITHVSPLYWLVLLQIFFILTFFYNIYKILKAQEDIVRPIIFILAPAYISFFLMSPASGRKEIMYYALISYVARLYIERSSEDKTFDAVLKVSLILLYPFIILSHEAFLAYLPFLLYFTKSKREYVLYSIPSITAFLVVMIDHSLTPHSIVQHQILEIAKSYLRFGLYVPPVGALAWLDVGTKHAFGFTMYHYLFSNTWWQKLIIYLINFVPLVVLYKERITKKIIWTMVLSFVILFPVYIVAIDWDRFTSAYLISSWLVILTNNPKSSNSIVEKMSNINPYVFTAFAFLISSIAALHNSCGGFRRSYGVLTATVLLRPIQEASYQRMINILNTNCKVVWCPANYKELVRIRMFDFNKYEKLPKIERDYIDYLFGIRSCAVLPNPYLDYKKQAIWCYDMLKLRFSDIGKRSF